MSNLPTIKQLRYLLAIEEHLHFGKAAESCFVTQSAFSLAIKELESLVGIALVERNVRHVILTEGGRKIAQRARRIIFDAKEIMEVAKTHAKPFTGEIKLGVIPTIAPFLLPALLPVISQRFPELKLYLKEDQTKKIYSLLISGELDLLLLALPYHLPGTQSAELCRDSFKLAFNEDTAIIEPERFSIRNTPDDSILLLEDGHCLRDHAISACDVASLNKISPFSANSLYTLVQMVNSDLGISFIPQLAIDNGLIDNTHIKTRSLDNNPDRSISLVWRKSCMRELEFIELGENIKNILTTKP